MILKESLASQINSLYIKSKKEGTIVTIEGNSMHPTLKDGWKIKVKPVDKKEISYNDVVVFKQKRMICHRLIGKFIFNKKGNQKRARYSQKS